MKVCEQLTQRFRGCILEYQLQVCEFKADGTVLVYDLLEDRYTHVDLKKIAMYNIVEGE